MSRKSKTKRLINGVAVASTVALVGFAIAQQLRTPSQERTWQGKVLGFPYDFRFPNKERIQAALWNSETSDILVPKAFGLGWDINLYPIFNPKVAISRTAHH